MFINHIKIAWRSLKKQPFFTFLNTFGLAIGMAGSLLIALYIYDELSFDKMFADADRIYRVNADIKFGGAEQHFSVVSGPMAAAIQRDFSQVELAARLRNNGSILIRKSGTDANAKENNSAFVDSTFFEMFGIKLIVGNTKKALTDPNTVVLTKSVAEKFFGVENALGQHLLLNNNDNYTVTGVIDDLPKNSLLRNHSVFLAMAGYGDGQLMEWTSHNYYTFIKLLPNADIRDFQAPLNSMLETYILPYAQKFYPGITAESFEASGNFLRYSTTALTDIHLYSNRYPELSANGSIQNVYILSFIGLFLIVLASVNFMNLSTAQSLKRAKEVGIRKTLGSGKSQLIRQFLTESGLITFLSLLLALALAMGFIDFFNNLSGKSITIPFGQPIFWMIMLLAVMVLGLFSGSYPAFFMSRFVAAKVLKGSGQNGVGGSKIRNTLVVFQFSISIFLIIGTMVVFEQLNYIQSKDLGYTKDQVLIINDTYAMGSKLNSFKEEVQQLGNVTSISIGGYWPTPSWRNDNSFYQEGAMEQENALQMQNWIVDQGYLSTIGLTIIAGRGFDEKLPTDSTTIILNESATSVLGIAPKDALGMRLSKDLGVDDPVLYTVIGVVQDFHYESLRKNIGALSLTLGNSTNSMAVKLTPGDFSAAISNIESIWNTMASGQLFSYRFMDDSFNSTYEAEQKLGRIFMVFAMLSIFIASLGLFGLAAFNAEKRTKEIGIRKVLGASIGQISYQLSFDFLKLVGVAILVSLPLGWYAMNIWLEDFSYRIEIGWWVLAASALLAVFIAIVTVSYQSIRASLANPVESLRTE